MKPVTFAIYSYRENTQFGIPTDPYLLSSYNSLEEAEAIALRLSDKENSGFNANSYFRRYIIVRQEIVAELPSQYDREIAASAA